MLGLLPLQGEFTKFYVPQGVALGYEFVGLSARPSTGTYYLYITGVAPTALNKNTSS